MNVEDWKVNDDVRLLVDYMMECVAVVVPFAPNKEKSDEPMETARTGAVGSDCDSDIEIIEPDRVDRKAKEDMTVEDITCEVSFDMDFKRCCLVCESEGELPYQVYEQGNIEFVCSQECMKILRSECKNTCHCCKGPMTTDSQGYLSNFAPQNYAFCSEQCLLQYEAQNAPSSQCFECTSVVKKTEADSVVYYWQTMNFCSIHCISKLQILIGEKCCFCKKKVIDTALGKYSVRFGDVVRQFCDGACLDSYKKDLLLCGFCQKDLKSTDPHRLRTVSSGKFKNREFCDSVCLIQFEKLVAAKNAAKLSESGATVGAALNVGCTQCQRIVAENDAMKVSYENDDYYLCGSTCIAAFKYTHNINSMICESCFTFDWSTSKLTQLQYSGNVKIFCSKKCVNVFVLKKRKIVGCMNCKVKKYDFDMIERYECTSNVSKMFCSVWCLKRFNSASESGDEVIDEPKFCVTCGKLATINVNIEGHTKFFCSSLCMTKRHSTLATILNTAEPAVRTSESSKAQPLPRTSVVLQAQEQPSVGTKVQNSTLNALHIVAPPSVSLSPATVASTMWTPFAPVQTTTTTSTVTKPQNSVQVTNPNSGTLQSMLQMPPVNQVALASGATTPRIGTTICRPTLFGVSQPQLRPNVTSVLTRPSITTQNQASVSATNSSAIVNNVKDSSPRVLQKIQMCNKAMVHRPLTRNKATGCKPCRRHVAVGPDSPLCSERATLIPVPIPIFIPFPVAYPQPLPFPLAAPVPLFFPSETIKNALNCPYSEEVRGNGLETNCHIEENTSRTEYDPCASTSNSSDAFHKFTNNNTSDVANSSILNVSHTFFGSATNRVRHFAKKRTSVFPNLTFKPEDSTDGTEAPVVKRRRGRPPKNKPPPS